MRIRTLGDPVLKEQARPVTTFDEKLQRLATQMAEVMEREEGVGLAATQVGVLSRMIVWRYPDDSEDLYVFVNPVITEKSEACTMESEGCLSLPGASVQVSRPEAVTVKADDLGGNEMVVDLSGFPARIVQHEVDHLDGLLILDRATPEERRRVMKELLERTLTRET